MTSPTYIRQIIQWQPSTQMGTYPQPDFKCVSVERNPNRPHLIKLSFVKGTYNSTSSAPLRSEEHPTDEQIETLQRALVGRKYGEIGDLVQWNA